MILFDRNIASHSFFSFRTCHGLFVDILKIFIRSIIVVIILLFASSTADRLIVGFIVGCGWRGSIDGSVGDLKSVRNSIDVLLWIVCGLRGSIDGSFLGAFIGCVLRGKMC
eukprot:470184_1